LVKQSTVFFPEKKAKMGGKTCWVDSLMALAFLKVPWHRQGQPGMHRSKSGAFFTVRCGHCRHSRCRRTGIDYRITGMSQRKNWLCNSNGYRDTNNKEQRNFRVSILMSCGHLAHTWQI
jgi:hypothetical protein